MKKCINKKKAKQNAASKPSLSVNINLPENMNAEETQHIIARAIIEAEEIKAQKEEEQRKIALEEWNMAIGRKECKNKIEKFFNYIKVFVKILFLRKEHIKGDRASLSLLKTVVSFFFRIMQWCLCILSILFIAVIPFQWLAYSVTLPWYQITSLVLCSIAFFILSRLFRMAGIETDNIDDRNYLFSIFASITSLVSIIIAVIAIVKGA